MIIVKFLGTKHSLLIGNVNGNDNDNDNDNDNEISLFKNVHLQQSESFKIVPQCY